MKYASTSIILFFSLLIADNNYCNLPDTIDNQGVSSSRQYYNIGDTISDEDQNYPHSVCYSDGNYSIDSEFRLSDFSGDIILVSMNATW